MSALCFLASVVQKLDARALANTLHGAVLGGLFLALALVSLLLVLQYRTGDLTPEGRRATVDLVKAACIAMAVVGWLAAASGSFGIDHWFRGAAATSPESLLRAHGYGAWVTVERIKEVVAWLSVLAGSAGAYLAVRRSGEIPNASRFRRRLVAVLAATTILAGLAGIMGVLLTKLAPIS